MTQHSSPSRTVRADYLLLFRDIIFLAGIEKKNIVSYFILVGRFSYVRIWLEPQSGTSFLLRRTTVIFFILPQKVRISAAHGAGKVTLAAHSSLLPIFLPCLHGSDSGGRRAAIAIAFCIHPTKLKVNFVKKFNFFSGYSFKMHSRLLVFLFILLVCSVYQWKFKQITLCQLHLHLHFCNQKSLCGVFKHSCSLYCPHSENAWLLSLTRRRKPF